MSLVFAGFACGTHASKNDSTPAKQAEPPIVKEIQPTMEPSALQKLLASAEPARAMPPSAMQKRIDRAIDAFHQRSQTRRLYLSLDKPLYQPGETIWFRAWEMGTRDLMSASRDGTGMTFHLVSPKGAVVVQKRVAVQQTVVRNDFELPADVPGGEYKIRIFSDTGSTTERNVIVSSYEPPRIKKKLEFLRKAYGPGDKVSAAIALHRATGEALSAHAATGIVSVDDSEIARVPLTTDPAGNAVVQFELPARIHRGDGLLTVLVEDGGLTESIQKRIPITLKKIKLSLYPEGGDLIESLPGRVYFQAKNLIDKPADVQGRVVDDRGNVVAELASFHNGLGRFELTPENGRSYHVEITRPVGIDQKFAVPRAKPDGCVMQSVDDFEADRDELRVGVWCTSERSVIATAMLREHELGVMSAEAGNEAPTVIALPSPRWEQGAVRVTLFSDTGAPLAERLVYRGRSADLKVSVSANRDSYSPRDQVALTIQTTDLAGKPVPADVALAVVDDTVLNFADDKTAHMLTATYLEAEMPGQKIEEPNFYFSDDPKAGPALDLVLGTQGWRRFDWKLVLSPQYSGLGQTGEYWSDELGYYRQVAQSQPEATANAEPMAGDDPAEAPRRQRPGKVGGKKAKDAEKMMRREAKPMAKAPMADPAPPPRGGRAKAERWNRGPGMDKNARDDRARNVRGAGGMAGGDVGGAMADGLFDGDDDWGVEGAEQNNIYAWAPVREFPAPNYEARYDGPRTDFRETIHWAPSVRTDDDGKAVVKFYLSDAVTSFRATAEGLSDAGLPGRGDVLVQSKLPVSLNAKLPLEVSAGDRVRLPVTLSNETPRKYTADVTAEFGAAFKVEGGVPKRVTLDPGERKSYFYTLDVVGDGKRADDGKIELSVAAANLKDELERVVEVVPLGFPQELSVAGTVDKVARHEVNLQGVIDGSINATLTMYPSPLATMTKGTEAIIREPVGCFEQASSANYPNIMVLSYLEQHDAADPDLITKTHGMLDRGYQKLTGYESPKKGYEWFGGDPGHEALTAYGLMEFADMAEVYGDVDKQMVRRTAAWLKSRRDGKGGYERNSRALDSFGRASDEVTNGYITWALTEAGEEDLDDELAYQRKMARDTVDPYVMALAANAMVNVEPDSPATRAAMQKLAKMRGEDGAYKGADHSITRSGGVALEIETTSLAAMALMRGGDMTAVRKSVEWLDGQRSGYGSYGSTQSTVLALKAMSMYAEKSRATRSSGVATLKINGKMVRRLKFEKGHRDALEFGDLSAFLNKGKNDIEIELDSKEPLPYSMAIDWRSKQPASSAETKVAVSTRLAKDTVKWGEGVRMHVSTRNITDEGIPMTLARVGLPGGLTFQTWQLKELKDKGAIDFYETRDREVILYFRSLGPKANKEIDLDLMATVPGEYVAPASTAYLYYTDEFKHWAEPLNVTVEK
jgi:hypothetical protein